MRGALIGAIVRDGRRSSRAATTSCAPGDRAIIFTESQRVPEVERAL